MLQSVLSLAVTIQSAACGGAPVAGPSPFAVAPSPAATPAAPAMPAGLDPAWVRTVAVLAADGRPKRWEGGPFRHCFDASTDASRGQLEAVADEMSAMTGIPRTDAGPCNVEWLVDHAAIAEGTGAAFTTLYGTDTRITKAVVRFKLDWLIAKRPALAVHEAGHVLGLMHSPYYWDVMYSGTETNDVAVDFSAEERALLAWIYQR